MENSNELYHYGIPGMRWGRHKYQDKYGGLKRAGRVKISQLASEHKQLSNIGSLTKKGEKRIADIEKQYEHLTGKSIDTHEFKKTGITGSKSIRDMTNEELIAYNTRKQLETTYLNYQPKPQISKGKAFVAKTNKNVVAPFMKEVNKQIIMPKVIGMIKQLDVDKKAAKAAK